MDLKTFREAQGWTLSQAANFADLSDGSVWRRYETGQRFPRSDHLDTIQTLSGGRVTADDHHKARRAFLDLRKERRAKDQLLDAEQ